MILCVFNVPANFGNTIIGLISIAFDLITRYGIIFVFYLQ